MMTLFPRKVLASLLLLLLLGACGTTRPPQAILDHDPQFDFSAVQRIYFEPFSRTDPATITISDMQVDRINASLAEELRSKGFEMVTDRSRADLFLTWYLVTEDNISMSSSPRYTGTSGSGSYTQGTLIVDMTDPMRNKAVWRSVFQSRLKSHPDPKESAAIRRTAVEAIFSNFPPAPTGGAGT